MRLRTLPIGPSAAERERAFESRRRPPTDDSPPDLDADLLRIARDALLDAARLVEISDALTGGEAGDHLLRLTQAEHEIRLLLGRLLAHLGALRAWRWLGCADLYAEQRLGIARSTAQDPAQLAQTSLERPQFGEEYECGRVRPAAALLVARFFAGQPVDDETERWWLTHAAHTTVKRLRREGGLRRFDRWMHRTVGPARPLDDGEWRRRQRRYPGQALDEILACARATADHPFADESLALRLPRPLAERFLATIDAAAEALTATQANREDGAGSVRMFSASCFSAGDTPLASGVGPAVETDKPPSWLGLLHVLASFAATFDPPGKSQSEVLDRDGWCCQAPACTGRSNLEQHHVTYRSESGNDNLDNLVTLCRFHHQRGEHDGLMCVRGRAPDDITFRLGPAHRGQRFRDERATKVRPLRYRS